MEVRIFPRAPIQLGYGATASTTGSEPVDYSSILYTPANSKKAQSNPVDRINSAPGVNSGVEGSAVILTGLLALFTANLGDLPPPDMVWFDPEPNANGQTMLGHTECGYVRNTVTNERATFCRIHINQCLKDQPEELIDTFLHELAHHVDWMSDEEWDGHDGQWKQLTRKWNMVDPGLEALRPVPGCGISMGVDSRIIRK